MKKFFAILLSVVMLLTMCTVAFAASGTFGDKGTITIDNAKVGFTYTIYRILNLESYDTVKDAYSYKVNPVWNDFFPTAGEGEEPTLGSKYVNIDSEGYVTWKDGADAAAFAKDALKWAKENNISNNGEIENTIGEGQKKGDTKSVEFSNLDLGYYLVDSSLGALCALDTTNPNVTVHEKNDLPKIDKTVEEKDEWGKTSDGNVGDTVNFQIDVTVEDGAQNYVVHDKMNSGLIFDNTSVVVMLQKAVYVDGQPVKGEDDKYQYEVATTLTNTDDVTYYTFSSSELTDGCTFEVAFEQSFLDTLQAYDKIIVKYSAEISAESYIEGPLENDAHLEYGDENETEKSHTNTYTWKFDVLKHNAANTPLSGAKFKLYSANEDGTMSNTVLNFKKITDTAEGESSIPTYQYTKTAGEGTTDEITTDDNGKFILSGLDSGIYYLDETEAPDGYNKLPAPVKIEIVSTETTDETGNVVLTKTIKKDGAETNTIDILNNTGSELPSTGGIGTTIFYVVGGLLMLGSVVLLVTKKKMSVNDD
ncbi:MAG: SpaH/EbpB family LPXTG-anchored major pilin [Clostridiales bacterium]|nr:SpaH/EbpB family LPXTG-anchored major pilin [Clostridiales bacterium]